MKDREINDVFIDETNHIYIAMPLYNLTEYSDNYSDTSGSRWQFDCDGNLTVAHSEPFKHKNSSSRKNSRCC